MKRPRKKYQIMVDNNNSGATMIQSTELENTMNAHYAKAIDLLMGGKVDFKTLAIELAKQNPELFCTLAVPAVQAVTDDAWKPDAIRFIRQGNLVSSIKLVREKTGFGLKEAKDVVDALRTRDGDRWFRPDHLNTDQRRVYDDLITLL
jgi:ribosomal protein L7/L12